MKQKGDLAKTYFLSGYNCAQAVLLAFSEETGLDEKTAMCLASSFGGGMGRLREVCGTVSAALMILGILHGYDATAEDAAEQKPAHYARVQEFAARFKAEVGTIICREILENHAKKLEAEKIVAENDDQLLAMRSSSPDATPRSEEYYQKRPCAEMARLAADILETYLAELAST